MQIRQSHVLGDRPLCTVDPRHKIYCHGHYKRNGDCNDKEPLIVTVLRFLCVMCRRTLSVLWDDLLPYRPVPVPLVEKHFDAQAQGTPPPTATEKEKGCLKRAWARFTGRVDALVTVLGQMITAVKPSASTLWKQLRQWGNLPKILLQLAEPYKTSLLGDYLCLNPWGP